MKRGERGFSLLEVMVAIAILALTLTVILSAQGGLAASNRSAANLGVATNLARCKMTELEEKLLKMGYPELDQIETETSCCEDADREGFKCDIKVEKVELPNPPQNSLGDGGNLLGTSSAAGTGSAGVPDPLAQLAADGLDGGVTGLS
ncbi:MAG TPA: prepilin-type N-terminal cleavage/methylation domain-containing protein, partial [Polyangia bacterium]|nr:prepilin-type N-terminal cleavage/methylation domain-containing protein [Polyangia bacterium]